MSDLQMLEALNRAIKREAELAALKARLAGLSAGWGDRPPQLGIPPQENNDE